MTDVVLVVDMVKGFCQPGCALFCGDESRKIIPNIRRLLEREQARGSRTLFTTDSHEPNDAEFKMFPPHCIQGTPEAEVIPELAEYATEVIPKRRFSSFFGTELDARLREIKPEKLIVCGVCTDICVMFTVADARNRDYQVEVPVDCVASFDPQAHRFALSHMERVLGARLVSLK